MQPVEIASALKRELDIGSVIVDRDRVLAPNRFLVRVSSADATRLKAMGESLERELLSVVNKHAARQGYQLLGGTDVELQADESLTTGVLEIDATSVDGEVSWTPVLNIDGHRHELRKGSTIIGRGGESVIRITDSAASRQHLEIIWDGKAGLARDLDSTNGSKINGQRFREAALSPGTVITIGQSKLSFQLAPNRTQKHTRGAQHPSGAPQSRVHDAGKSAGRGVDQSFWGNL